MKKVILVLPGALVSAWVLTGCMASDSADMESSEAAAMSIAANLELSFPAELTVSPSLAQPLSDVLPDDVQAVVHWGSVLSFVPTVSRQQRLDILNSTNFAKAAARFDGGSGFPSTLEEAEERYDFFLTILESLGWTVVRSGFQRYSSEEEELRMDRVALEVIGDIATSGQIDVLTDAVEILKSLPEDADAITLFERLAAEGSRGFFEVGSAEVDSNGFLSFCTGGFYYEAMDERRGFLFVRWGAREVAFWMTAQCMTLNDEVYSEARDAVVARLREKSATTAGTTPLAPVPSAGPGQI